MLGYRRPGWMMLLTPAAIGSLAVVMVLAKRHRFSLPAETPRGPKLARLRSAILGSTKRKIASMLGPPRVTQSGADATWYYPLSKEERLALAISFEQDRARQVEFVRSPA
jgi:outer membrane protein assembly factor BamE (lipoprotein component of BamABCDE complex)